VQDEVVKLFGGEKELVEEFREFLPG